MATLLEELQIIRAAATQNVVAVQSVIDQYQSYKTWCESLPASTVKARTARRIDAILAQLVLTKQDFSRQITGINMSITDLGGNVEVVPPVIPPVPITWSTGEW